MWEYRTEIFDVEANGKQALESLLAEAGRTAWELVAVAPAFEQLLLLFKRSAH